MEAIALGVFGLVFVGGVIGLALWKSQRSRVEDAELVHRVTECFEEVARRRNLSVTQPPPYPHPVVGEIPFAPTLSGRMDDFRVTIAIETDGDSEAWSEWTSIRLRGDGGWPTCRDARRSRPPLSAPADAALDALLDGDPGAWRVSMEADAIVVVPDVAERSLWDGRRRRIETDPDRLERLLLGALEFARALSAQNERT